MRTQTPSQSGGSGPSRVLVIIAITFLGLLLCLGIGMFVFRRMLLPPINVKRPSRGARPWSRTRVPNPSSLGSNDNAEGTQATRDAVLAFAAANSRFGPGPNGFEQSNNGYAPPNISVAHMQQEFDPAKNGFGPQQGFEPAYHDANAPTLAGFGPQDMNGLPDDPFASSQGGEPGWPENLGGSGGGKGA